MNTQTTTRMPMMREEDMIRFNYSRGKRGEWLAREVQLWRNNNAKKSLIARESGDSTRGKCWRRRRDLNPRDPFRPNGFQDRRFQPLTHSSAFNYNWQRH